MAARLACARLRSHVPLIKFCNSPNVLIPVSRPAVIQVCNYSNKGFVRRVLDNIRQDKATKDVDENLKKFLDETAKIEQSEKYQQVRRKYNKLLEEDSNKLKKMVGTYVDELSKTELGKKAGEFTEDLGKTAKGAAETIARTGQTLGSSGAFRTVSQTATVIRDELETSKLQGRVYCPPATLRKRKDPLEGSQQIIEPNTEATGMELHKDSRFYQSWQNFKDSNPYVNKALDWKTRYDESDNPVVRASRLLTDKVSEIMGGLFQKTELSEALTDICRVDPDFDKVKFVVQCEQDIIPNILEAVTRGDLEILEDWCYEAPFNILATPIREARKQGLHFKSQVLDISDVDILMGKVTEHGPVLFITFRSQQFQALCNSKGEVVSGSLEKIYRVDYVWVLCRDETELDPRAAWRLLEVAQNANEQMI